MMKLSDYDIEPTIHDRINIGSLCIFLSSVDAN